MAAKFIPRAVFPPLDSLPRSYYLGHHAAGLAKMNSMLSQIDLIIECRDYRVPLTSRNPLFEHSLAGRERLVVYTKRDLGNNGKTVDAGVGFAVRSHTYRFLILIYEIERDYHSPLAPTLASSVLRPQRPP